MNTIVKMKFGSHLYGTQTPNSDTDYKEICIPEIQDLILGTVKHNIVNTTGGDGKNTKEDVDYDIISIQSFIKNCLKGETFALDMLHCENPIITSGFWKHIVRNRKRFYTKNMSSYIGYVKTQAAKYSIKGSRLAEIKRVIEAIGVGNDPDMERILLSEIRSELPVGEYSKFTKRNHPKTLVEEEFYEVNGKLYALNNNLKYVKDRLQLMYDGYGDRAKLAEKNEGVDWKSLHHALRAGYQARSIYYSGDFKYPLDETSYLMAVKKGKCSFKSVAKVLEDLVDEVMVLSQQSDLPLESDSAYWDDFIVNKVYGEVLR